MKKSVRDRDAQKLMWAVLGLDVGLEGGGFHMQHQCGVGAGALGVQLQGWDPVTCVDLASLIIDLHLHLDPQLARSWSTAKSMCTNTVSLHYVSTLATALLPNKVAIGCHQEQGNKNKQQWDPAMKEQELHWMTGPKLLRFVPTDQTEYGNYKT
jgi:hypothetical protein